MPRVSIKRVVNTVARNLMLSNAERWFESMIEWAFEAEKKIGSMDTFLLKERKYSSTPAAATGYIQFDAIPVHGDTIDINGVRFRFVNTGAAGNQINIEAGDIDTTIGNAVTVLNASTDTAVDDADYTADTTNDQIDIEHNQVGASGNEFTLGSLSENTTLSGATLTDGRDKIQNKFIVLPADLVRIVAIKDNDGDYGDIYGPTPASFPSSVSREQRFYVKGDRLYISEDKSYLCLSYMAAELDSDNLLKILDGHEDAIAAYIVWKLKTPDYINGKIPRYIWIDLQREWDRLCAQARGNDNMPNPAERKQVAAMWNTLVPIVSSNNLRTF